jgi:hypothetical protein
VTALLLASLTAAAVGARAANLTTPPTNAAQLALEGCGSGLRALGGDRVFDIVETGVEYRVHVFDVVGSSPLVFCQPREVEYRVVGGGGGGRAGGGTGGAVITNLGTPMLWLDGTYAVVVGDGGAGDADGVGGDGGHSSVSTIDAAGGTGGDAGVCSGGAGAGGAGESATDCLPGGFGGAGFPSSLTSESVFYGGGGGGGTSSGPSPSGGQGGGGGGGVGLVAPASNGTPGIDGSGGGGGGSDPAASGSAGAGGSGIVIVRYQV